MPLFLSRKKLENEISKRASEACDQIVSEMGAEIHDDLIQKLSVFRLYIDQLERSASNAAEIENLVIKMRADFEHVIRAVKSTSRRLLPSRMEGDTLDKSIANLCREMEQPGTGHIHFSSEGDPKSLDQQVEMHLLRIAQELIQNAFKHSFAWHVWVRLRWHTDKLVLEVEDDGSGFSKIPEFVATLRRKNNTLRMRTTVIGATIDYAQGQKGLLVNVAVRLHHNIPLRNA